MTFAAKTPWQPHEPVGLSPRVCRLHQRSACGKRCSAPRPRRDLDSTCSPIRSSGSPNHSHRCLTRARARAGLTRSPPCERSWTRAAHRERAIARAIESERARLSATLLQRGLFDRRAERALSAQTAVLDEALARCRARLDEIASTAQIVAEPAALPSSSSDDDRRRTRPAADRVVHPGCVSDAAGRRRSAAGVESASRRLVEATSTRRSAPPRAFAPSPTSRCCRSSILLGLDRRATCG